VAREELQLRLNSRADIRGSYYHWECRRPKLTYLASGLADKPLARMREDSPLSEDEPCCIVPAPYVAFARPLLHLPAHSQQPPRHSAAATTAQRRVCSERH